MAERTATELAVRCRSCNKLYPANSVHDCEANKSAPAKVGGLGSVAEAASAASAAKPVDPLEATAAIESKSAAEVTVPEPGFGRSNDFEDMIGAVLGERLEFKSCLGRGGMGVVFRARHIHLNKDFAVKILLHDRGEESRARFLKEAQLACKVTHENLVTITDFGILDEKQPYLVMELLTGSTLSRVIDHQPVDPLRTCRIGVQIANGLAAVHAGGIVHRDLKPDNIFILEKDGGDHVKIVDFGIARVVSPSEGSAPAPAKPDLATFAKASAAESLGRTPVVEGLEAPARGGNVAATTKPDPSPAALTMPGAIMGTPYYIPPEQAQAVPVDARADQYSFGCILYEMLTGEVPFRGEGVAHLLVQHLTQQPVPPRQRKPEAEIPSSLEAVVLRLLEKKPGDRYPSMKEVAQALTQEIERLEIARGLRKPQRSPYLLPVVALLSVAVLGGGFFAYQRTTRKPTLRPGELQELRGAALATMDKGLKDPDRAVRLQALSDLGTVREPQLRPALESLLKSGDEQLAELGAFALGRLGTKESLPVLQALSANTPGHVRIAADEAASRLGDAAARRRLQELLEVTDQKTRQRAASALCELGDEKGKALLKSAIANADPQAESTRAVLRQLCRAGDKDAQAKLRGLLQQKSQPEVVLQAAADLSAAGDPEARELLRKLAQSPGPEQLIAARVLATPEEPKLAALFRGVLSQSDATEAARILAIQGMGLSGEPFDARLLGGTFVKAEAPRLRLSAAAAVLLIAAREPGALSERSLLWAQATLSDSDWATRQAAAAVLGDVRDESAVPMLASLLKDNDTRVRRSAVRALGRRKDHASFVALKSGLSDSDAAVRTETLVSMAKVGQFLWSGGARYVAQEAAEWLRGTMNSGPEKDQLLSSLVLSRLGDETQQLRLNDWLRAPDAGLRFLLIDNLDREIPPLKLALTDSSFNNRFAAAQHLAALGVRDALPVLKEGLSQGGAAGLIAQGLIERLGEGAAMQPPSEAELAAMSVEQRLALVNAAAKLSPERALVILAVASRDGEPLVRQQVAEVGADLPLGKDGPPAISILRQLCEDADERVRNRASVLLSRVLGPAPPAPSTTAPPPTAEPERPAPPVASPKSTPAPAPSVDGGSSGSDAGAPADLSATVDAAAGSAAATEPAPAQTETPPKDGTTEAEKPADGKLTKLQKLADTGFKAYDRKEYGKAQKALEKVQSSCQKGRKLTPECATVVGEAGLRLGKIYEAQDRPDSAMTEYEGMQKRADFLKLTPAQLDTVSSSMKRLEPRLGRITIPKFVKKKCQEVTIWATTGQQVVEVDGQSVIVKVQAGKTAQAGSCAGATK